MKKLFVLGVAALLMVAFTVPAMAETKVGGIVFTDFYYYKQSEEKQSGGVPDGASATDGDWASTRIQVPIISRLYVRWTNEHNVGMYFESGVGDNVGSGQSGGGNNTLRHLYGWWDATPNFQILAGHSTTPFSPLTPTQLVGTSAPGQTHVIGVGYGEYYAGRYPQVRFTFKFSEMVRAAIAFIDPHQGGSTAGTALTPEPGKAVDEDATMPRIDIGVPIYIGPVKLYPGLMWQEKTFDDVASGDDSVTSYAWTMGVSGGFGPLVFQGEINAGKNMANTNGLGFRAVAPTQLIQASTAYVKTDGSVEDSDCMGWWAEVGFKAGPATISVTYGQASAQNDRDGGNTEYDVQTAFYGAHAVIPVAKTFLIRPEIMFYDNDDAAKVGRPDGRAVDYGKESIYGVCFMISF
jgi:hypothetical protein